MRLERRAVQCCDGEVLQWPGGRTLRSVGGDAATTRSLRTSHTCACPLEWKHGRTAPLPGTINDTSTTILALRFFCFYAVQ